MPSSREIIKIITKAGWVLDRVKGDHHVYKHPEKPLICTVPHPKRDMKRGTVRSLEKVTGLKLWK